MTEEKKKALGRGLESLLPAARKPAAGSSEAGVRPGATSPGMTVASGVGGAGEILREVGLELIERNPYQTRMQIREDALKELADSIRESGVLQPVVVRPLKNGRYQMVAGERRLQASRQAGKASIPAVVREMSDQQALEMTIIENLQREDLSPIEQARAFNRLVREFNLTQEQIAQRTGKDRSTIANYLRLLKLPFEAQEELRYNFKITFSHAKLLLMLDSEEQIQAAVKEILRRNLSVLQLETLVFNMRNPIVGQAPAPGKPVDPNVKEAERMLQRTLGCRVQIRDKKGKGKITIHYGALSDFDRVVEMLTGKKR